MLAESIKRRLLLMLLINQSVAYCTLCEREIERERDVERESEREVGLPDGHPVLSFAVSYQI
jgi:hypothetical protein